MINIRKLKIDNRLIAIVTASSYENPMSFISDIEEQLSLQLDNCSNTKIIFDLLCSNGFESNRFVSMRYESRHLKRDSFKVVSLNELDSKIVKTQSMFFKHKPELLQDSVLTQEEIHNFLVAN